MNFAQPRSMQPADMYFDTDEYGNSRYFKNEWTLIQLHKIRTDLAISLRDKFGAEELTSENAEAIAEHIEKFMNPPEVNYDVKIDATQGKVTISTNRPFLGLI